MKNKYFLCGQKPSPVFGDYNVSIDPFTQNDILETFGEYENEDFFIGLYMLKDARFASVYVDKHGTYPGSGAPLNGSLAYVAKSFEKIVRLGLTVKLRNVLGV